MLTLEEWVERIQHLHGNSVEFTLETDEAGTVSARTGPVVVGRWSSAKDWSVESA